MSYLLLDAFRDTFLNKIYRHRSSTAGDLIAMHFFEDLYFLNRSSRYRTKVDSKLSVLNTANKRHGIKARRGDGSFGEVVPHTTTISDPGYNVARGSIATIEIGIEVKILMKAMIKQIDRVESDLKRQADHFRSRGGNPITIGIVGINQAPHCTTYEGSATWPTDGGKYKHPVQEAAAAESRLQSAAASAFDEFLFLKFSATNVAPFNFSWVNQNGLNMDYGAALSRVSSTYQSRF